MTTIGYGDIVAAKYPDYPNGDNMALVFFLEFMAIFTFSLIQNKLFSIQYDVKLKEIVGKAVAETEVFLSDIDRVLKKMWEKDRKRIPKDAADPEKN